MEKSEIRDLADAAKFLGVSKAMMYRYVDQRKLTPCYRRKRIRGDPILFRLRDLQEFKRGRKSKMEGGDSIGNEK